MPTPQLSRSMQVQPRIGAQTGAAQGTGPVGGGFSLVVKFNKLPAYAEGIGRRARKENFGFLQDVDAGLRKKMREPKHGRTYVIKGKIHVASAPGEAPAILSGETQRSIQIRNIGLGASAQITVGGAGKFLQYGTRRMARRHMLIEEINERRGEYQERIKTSIRFAEG